MPDFLMIASIITLVVLTSLPRLRAFVVRSNETDARETLRRLVAHDFETASFSGLLGESAELRRGLQDGHLSDDGSLLCFHGFCYVITRSDATSWSVIAWPEHAGQSGVRAYFASSAGELWAHPNGQARWSGPERAPVGVEPALESGWRPWGAVAAPGALPQ